MRVSVIGTGYVGLVTGVVFAEKGHDVCCVDADASKVAMLQSGRPTIYEPGLEPLLRKHNASGRLRFTQSVAEGVGHGEVVFIAVGTPPDPEGAADLSQIEAVAREIAQALREYRVIVEKSTVPVETGERVARTIAKFAPPGVPFDVVSNPEFLREGSAIADALKPDRVVIGCGSSRAEAVLRSLYTGFAAPILVTDIKSAELIKHASNSFLALKISYANALARICDLAGADVTEVVEGMGLDPRIGRAFLNAGIGYGGSCFPKDVAAFLRIAEDLGYPFRLLEAVQDVNHQQVRYFLKKLQDMVWVVKEKRVGVLGLAFKPDTDDMRNAPAVPILQWLLDEGAEVRAYDPQAMDVARRLLPSVTYTRDAYETAEGADALLLLTEWEEFRTLDLERLRKSMRVPILLDGRNLYHPRQMVKAGFTYRAMGRAAKEREAQTR
jgi:UDPglucose 6-dehydrogenase